MAEYKFDPVAPEVMADPGPHFAELAEKCPFYHYQGAAGNFWITSNTDEILKEVLVDSPVWSFKWGNAAKDTAHDTGIVTDPPFHNKFRNALLPGLNSAQIKRLQPRIEALANELIDKMLLKERGCLHDDFAMPLPAQVMCMMLGAPLENHQQYKLWADELIELMFHDTERGSHKAIFKIIYDHFMGLVEERRTLLTKAGIEEPELHHLGDVISDDYISRTLCVRVEGRRFTDMEIVNVCTAFMTGGQETTTSLITNAVWRVLQDRALWERLQVQPELIPVAVEESLRLDPPVLAHSRTNKCPVSMHGHELPERSKLMFSIAGLNRDPKRFPDPGKFDLDRPLNQARQHIAFGSGVHFCIGAPVARLEAQIALQLLTTRLPKLRLEGDGTRIATWMYWGRHSLPVAWG
ncbi:MAG: cytochrome P450 [Sphingorhabdus sp.]